MTRTIAAFSAFFFALALCAPSLHAARDKPQPRARGRSSRPAALPAINEVRLQVGNIADGNRFDAPTQGLSMALKSYPQASRFRVQWTMGVAGQTINASALYDRRARTLTFFSAGRFFGSRVRESWRDFGVTDALLHRLAARHRGASAGNDSAFFSELARMGAKRQRLP